jgi:hypothetical protein
MASTHMSSRATESWPTITAKLIDGPPEGMRFVTAVVEGRPPKIIELPTDDGSRCRYCLADWSQGGPSAVYTFLYGV